MATTNEAPPALIERLKGVVPSTFAGEEVDELCAPDTDTPLARWTLTASSGLDAEQGHFTDACTVTVQARTEAEALTKARSLVRRHWYRVQTVEEVTGE